jgi:carboxyl-terminal processing protease
MPHRERFGNSFRRAAGSQARTVIGLTSFGKGSVQTIIPLGEARGALRLTTARYLHAVPVIPSRHRAYSRHQVAQGDEAALPKLARPSEADFRGHLNGRAVPAKRINAPVIKPAPATNMTTSSSPLALDLLHTGR